jgi:uncharacterized protein (DUF58 family)
MFFSDIFGFFRAGQKIQRPDTAPLLAVPARHELRSALRAASGGIETDPKTGGIRLNKENLTDQRPYIAGDDPRRINWKLYGHVGDLFVREDEREKPPHSEITLFCDTVIDTGLYTAEEGRLTVDKLCTLALSICAGYIERGILVKIAFSDDEGKQKKWTVLTGIDEAQKFLALPYALFCSKNQTELVSPSPANKANKIMTLTVSNKRETKGNIEILGGYV